jgi:general secretion pathway protein F
MKRFEIRVLNADASVQTLVIDALDESDARLQVGRQGLTVVRLKSFGAMGSIGPLGGGARPRFALVLFAQELLVLLEAGLSIVESLEALCDQAAAPSTRSVLARLLGAVREGRRFSAALVAQREVFPPLFIGVVQASEGTSDLPQALRRFLEYRRRVDAVRNKVSSAAIYPTILMGVGALVTLFLVGYVVPRFAEVYEGSGRELPLVSQVMLELGRFASAHLIELLLATLTTVVLLGLLARRLWRSGAIARAFGAIPGLGERLRVFELARLYRTLGMLLGGGIPLVSAMTTVDAVISTAWRERLAAARALIEAGTPLSLAFERCELTTPISLRLLSVGERSGELASMLEQSAVFHDGEIERWIDRFTRSFEPLLMAAIGIVVGVIVVMLYMPIFDLAGGLQ